MKQINQLPVYVSVQLENAGDGRGTWLDLPATRAKFADTLAGIGCEGGEGVRIAAYRAYGTGLTANEAMRAPLSVMNYLAARLRKLTPGEMLKLRAVTDSDHYFSQAGQVIDYTFDTGRYALLPGVTDEEKLGRHYLGAPEPGGPARHPVSRYEFGKKLAASQGGVFVPHGYLTCEAGWEPKNELRPVPASLNLRGALNEDLYGDWENYDLGA